MKALLQSLGSNSSGCGMIRSHSFLKLHQGSHHQYLKHQTEWRPLQLGFSKRQSCETKKILKSDHGQLRELQLQIKVIKVGKGKIEGCGRLAFN